METLSSLRQAGAEIKGHPYLHFKCLLIDDASYKKGLIFSGNITEESFGKSHDVGIFLNSTQYDLLLNIVKKWENVIPGVFVAKEFISNLPTGMYWKWNKNKYEFHIQPSEIHKTGVFEGDNIDTYDNYKPNFEIPEALKETTKEIIFKWVNLPPRLPKKSEQLKELPEKLPKKVKDLLQKYRIYQNGKEYYLLYQEGDSLKELRKLSELTNYKIVTN